MHRINFLLKSLAFAVLAISLTFLPLYADSCVVTCDSVTPGSVQNCALSVLSHHLPELPAPTCCTSEHLQGHQYFSGRQKPREHKTPRSQMLPSENRHAKAGQQFIMLGGPGAHQPFASAASTPLHILHASFLV